MYLLAYSHDDLALIDETVLSDYVLSDENVQQINAISNDTSTLTANIMSDIIAKVGPGAANKQTLNALYVQKTNSGGFTEQDLRLFKEFVNYQLVGHKIIDTGLLTRDANE